MGIEKNFLRQVMGHFVTGVTVVTTQSQGKAAGLTVNSFTSVSLEPPLILICVDLNSTTLPSIRESGAFAVNILNSNQEELSRCFATTSSERFNRFCNASYRTAATGSPILDDALAFVDARIVAEYPGGDHVIFLGQVEALGTTGHTAFADDTAREKSTVIEHSMNGHSKEKAPLAYYRGQYRHLASNYSTPSLPKEYDKAVER